MMVIARIKLWQITNSAHRPQSGDPIPSPATYQIGRAQKGGESFPVKLDAAAGAYKINN